MREAAIERVLACVHVGAGVWVHGVDLRADAAVEAECCALLDEEDRARAARFKVAERRRQFVITRGALRLLLARHLARPAPALRFAAGPYGKPFAVLDGAPTRLEFNVSHTAGRGLIAIAHAAVGVDIEFLGREADLDLVARGVFTAAEQAALQRRAGAERALLFYRLWTQKEALIKAKGTGFACPPRGFAAPAALREGARSAPFSFPGETARWLVTDLTEGAWAAALALALR
jgi:4'-phosphopantetheinyl transferase